jgi:hypothetical protein
MTGKITNVTHVRELSGLELQAVEFALGDSLVADDDLVLTLGTETIGGKTLPFVALCREGSKHQVIVHFRDKDKTAEARRSYEGKSGPVVKRPPVAKKPAAVAKK